MTQLEHSSCVIKINELQVDPPLPPIGGQSPSISAHLADNLHECLLWLKACSLSQMSTRITLIQVAALAGVHKTSSATLVRAACNVQRAAIVASANQLKNYAQLTRGGSRQAGVGQSVVKWACGRQQNKLNATATTSATMTANKCATALHALPRRPSDFFLSPSLAPQQFKLIGSRDKAKRLNIFPWFPCALKGMLRFSLSSSVLSSVASPMLLG